MVLVWLDGLAWLSSRDDLAEQITKAVALGFATAAGAAAAWAGRLTWKRLSSVVHLADVAKRLAVRAHARVTTSPGSTAVHRSLPMTVRFRHPIAGRRPAVTGEPGAEWASAPVEGQVARIAEHVRTLPVRTRHSHRATRLPPHA